MSPTSTGPGGMMIFLITLVGMSGMALSTIVREIRYFAVCWIALRGTTPRQRPAILDALRLINGEEHVREIGEDDVLTQIRGRKTPGRSKRRPPSKR